jgi:hypothetical protein
MFFADLSDDIRGQGILDERDPVTEIEFALLQALNLDDILTGRGLQRLDRGIEVTVLLLQLRKLRPEFRLFLFCHICCAATSALILKVFSFHPQ